MWDPKREASQSMEVNSTRWISITRVHLISISRSLTWYKATSNMPTPTATTKSLARWPPLSAQAPSMEEAVSVVEAFAPLPQSARRSADWRMSSRGRRRRDRRLRAYSDRPRPHSPASESYLANIKVIPPNEKRLSATLILDQQGYITSMSEREINFLQKCVLLQQQSHIPIKQSRVLLVDTQPTQHIHTHA